ncbi:unnamed protein product [Enterobius vermicularis]|uniref:Helitron_like_N domain-containing protein n=1 Tax=Enterobius vermicularis TaxID=51028 RepID=A0A0N4UYL6_ENTVE|nr:unnamed protein product [Enterobius vermicularis]
MYETDDIERSDELEVFWSPYPVRQQWLIYMEEGFENCGAPGALNFRQSNSAWLIETLRIPILRHQGKKPGLQRSSKAAGEETNEEKINCINTLEFDEDCCRKRADLMISGETLKYQDLSGGKRGHGWTSLEFEVQSFYVDTYCYILLRSDLSPVCQYVIATNKRGKRNIIGNGDKILAKFYIENMMRQRELMINRYTVNSVSQFDKISLPNAPGLNLAEKLKKQTHYEVKFVLVVVGAAGEYFKDVAEERDVINSSARKEEEPERKLTLVKKISEEIGLDINTSRWV